MPTAETSFDSPAARTGRPTDGAARWRVERGKRHGHPYTPEAGAGETGWWCAEMRAVLWATLGAVGATGLLLFGAPALY